MNYPNSKAALRDLIISGIYIAVTVLFLVVDYRRITSLRAAGSPVPVMRWIQVPIWAGMLVFWIRNGWQSWQRFHANDSAPR